MYMYMYNLFWGELERRKREGGREGGRERQTGRQNWKERLVTCTRGLYAACAIPFTYMYMYDDVSRRSERS